jgi:hypothetical protein
MAQKAGLLARLFPSRKEKKELCCGIQLEEIEDASATPVAPAQASCACSSRSIINASRPAQTTLGPVELSANHFLIRRAEVLGKLPRNPYEVHFNERGTARGIVVARAPTPTLNRVFGADLEDPAAVGEFDDWFKRFHAVPAYQVLGAGDEPAAAPSGFNKLSGWDHVILKKDDLDDLEEVGDRQGDVRVELIGKDEAETFIRIYAEAFNYPSAIVQPLCRSAEILIGEPDVLSYIATVSGEPVSVGQLFLSTHGAAFLGSTGTIPAARRAGCQGLLDKRRMLDARKAGYQLLCRTVALNSQSWRNALKVGFKTTCREEVYTPAAMMAEASQRGETKGARDGCCTTQLPASVR